ncbi:MAG: T9SS type A sorting domain-containing protein, partial [Candidatus Poribacteria bacterium]|nr:T9SS type A sorting domain-containing protein [Candidatus Poribacteria bacterium]
DPTERIDDWNALTFDEVDLIRIDDRKYAGTYRNFSVPGDYTVIVNADNLDGGADPVQTTITVPGASVSAPWDVDGNGRVEVFDLVIVGSNFGQSGPGVRGDVDGNGVVDIFDLVQVGSHFGESTTPGAPPLMSVRSHSFEKQRRSSGEDVRSYESLQQALSQLESMSNSSRGVIIARDVLRAWFANVMPVVTETKLHPNYPNPFNPETWIPYQLASDAAVEISIYDVRGALVRRLDFGHQPAGYYTAQDKAAYWDGRSETGEWVSSGLYFYHLRAGHFTAVKRMVIRK